MSLVDRLVCAREGHVPSVTFGKLPDGLKVTSVITKCVRCGKHYEAKQC